jgi:hypothetical protein
MATLEEEIPTEAPEEEGGDLLPGQLPNVKLSADQRRELISWLTEELNAALRDRQKIEDEWEEILTLYEATEIEGKKDFPFVGAATVMIPVIATACEEAWAALLGIIFSPKDVFSSEPVREDFRPTKDALKRFISWAIKEELDLEAVCSNLFLEFVKLGTMVAKTIYTEETRTLKIYDPGTRSYRDVVENIRHSPEVLRVPIKDFLFPIETRSLEDSRWKAHRFRLSWNQVLQRQEDGRFDEDAVDAIRNHYTTQRDNIEEALAQETNTTTAHLKEHEFFEVWFEFSLKEDAEDQDAAEEIPVRLIATLNKDTGTLMRVQHNWYPLQLDPFSVCPFIPRENMLWGIGAGRMGVPFQIEVSAMHCQRLDNQTILNCVAFKYKADSMMSPNITLTPGRGIPLEDPVNDLIPLVLGQKFDSTLQEEEHTLRFYRDRLGIGKETELGETSTNAIIRSQEARIKSNAVLKGVRRFLTDIIEKVILLYAQHYPDKKIEGLLGPEGRLVEELFNQPLRSLYYGLGISVTATNSAVSKDLDRQNKLALFNLLVQYYQQAVTYLQPTQNAQVPEVLRNAAMEIINGLGSFVRELLDDFDIPGRDKLIIDPDRLTQFAASGRSPEEAAGDVLQPDMESVRRLSPPGA